MLFSAFLPGLVGCTGPHPIPPDFTDDGASGFDNSKQPEGWEGVGDDNGSATGDLVGTGGSNSGDPIPEAQPPADGSADAGQGLDPGMNLDVDADAGIPVDAGDASLME